ncbi:hypothetical protein ES703_43584 [subsurface metagenome]
MHLGVKHLVGYAPPLQQVTQVLGLFYRDSAHQHRPPLLMKLLYLTRHRPVLGFFVFVNLVRIVLPNHRFMGGYNHYVQLVYLVKFLRLGKSGTRHSRQLLIHPEVVLNGNGGKGSGFPLNPYVLLGFYRLMQTLGVPATEHQPAGKFVHDKNLTILDHVIAVFLIQGIGFKGAVQVTGQRVI